MTIAALRKEAAEAAADDDIERYNNMAAEEERRELLARIAKNAQDNPHYRDEIRTLSPSISEAIDGRTEPGLAGGDDAAESLERLRARARSEADVLEHPEDSRSELLAIDDLDLRGREYNYQPGAVELEELRKRVGGLATPEDSKSELLGADAKARRAEEENARRHQAELDEALVNRLKNAQSNEQREYMAGVLDIENATGQELEPGEFVLPSRIAKKYIELQGKYYTHDRPPKVAFEDRGAQLRTATVNREAIGDMVALAHAKQWDSLKVTGSREFRREVWVEAESQGIKTTGYTPTPADLAALEFKRRERATNSIQPNEPQEQRAPRHDINKNQAQMHIVATEQIPANTVELKRNPALAGLPLEELSRLAYWRGIAKEAAKFDSTASQEETLARFDKAAENTTFLDRLESKPIDPARETNEHEHIQKKGELSL